MPSRTDFEVDGLGRRSGLVISRLQGMRNGAGVDVVMWLGWCDGWHNK